MFPFACDSFAVEERDVVEDVERLVDPALLLAAPPGVAVVERDADPAQQRLLQTDVAPPLFPPTKQFDELVARERDLAVLEVALLRQLHESQQDLVIERRWQAVLFRSRDRELACDTFLPPLIPDRVLETERPLVGPGAIREQRQGELRQVHLVPSLLQFLHTTPCCLIV